MDGHTDRINETGWSALKLLQKSDLSQTDRRGSVLVDICSEMICLWKDSQTDRQIG